MSKKAPVITLNAIDFDGASRAAEAVAHANNVPTNAYPHGDPKGPGGKGESVVQLVQDETGGETPAPVAKAKLAPPPVKVPMDDALDAWITQQVSMERCTKQFVILRALKKAGAPINLRQVSKDGRRER